MSTDKFGVVYADISKGHAVTENGIKFCFEPGATLYKFLLQAVQFTPVNRVYLVGELPGNYKEWLTNTDMYRYWRTQSIGHMLDGQNTNDYVARYEHRVSHKKLDVRSIERWLGTTECTVFEARSAMLLIAQNLRGMFPLFKHLSGTPATTFSVVWKQYNGMEKKQFPPLASEIRELIQGSTGQGRIEYFEENMKGNAPGLYYYDGIFMYAALCWGLPTEVETHDFENVFVGKQFARYRIDFRVPDGWWTLGPFGVRDEEGAWFYPGKNYRGFCYETWVDGAELDALTSLYAGTAENAFQAWNIHILERIVYKDAKDSTVKDPINPLMKKLVVLRNKLEEDGKQDVKHAKAYKLARNGIRSMALHGIGMFNRQAGSSTYICLKTETPPANFTDWDELEDGRIVYIVPEEREADTTSHPEWPACVWGRCRARMFKYAMSQRYEDLATIRTDAIATLKQVKPWEAGKEIGQLRRKWAIEKPLKAPATAADFDELQRKIQEK